MQSCIELQGMEFYAYHGVMPQERAVGNRFVVDLEIAVDVVAATSSDQLEDTLSYADIYDLVSEEMATPSKLIEHVAGRIVERLHSSYPQISSLWVRVTKKTPPMKGVMQGASISLRASF